MFILERPKWYRQKKKRNKKQKEIRKSNIDEKTWQSRHNCSTNHVRLYIP